jgi:hypothetical protein
MNHQAIFRHFGFEPNVCVDTILANGLMSSAMISPARGSFMFITARLTGFREAIAFPSSPSSL